MNRPYKCARMVVWLRTVFARGWDGFKTFFIVLYAGEKAVFYLLLMRVRRGRRPSAPRLRGITKRLFLIVGAGALIATKPARSMN